MSDQAAFQEIDDAVRQDELKAWWKRWGTPLIVAFVLLIAVTVAVIQYRKYDQGQKALAGAAFTAAVANLEPLTGPERAYRLSVRELQALAAQRKGDMKRAREIWAEIARDPGAPQGALQRAQAMLNFGGAEGTIGTHAWLAATTRRTHD